MARILFKRLPLCWVLEQVSLCMSSSTAEPSFLQSSTNLLLSPADFQRQTLQGLLFLGQVPGVGGPSVGLDLLAPQGQSLCW